MDAVNQMSNHVNKTLDFVNNNKILSSVLGMLLVLYAAMAAPKLPKYVVKVFDNTFFKLGYMFMIAYLATKDPSVAIITATALLITLQTLSSHEASDKAEIQIVGEIKPEPQPEAQPIMINNVPMSPQRAELINESTIKAEAHQEAAVKAEAEGNVALATAHKTEAFNQEVKIEGAINAKKHQMAAHKAQSDGDAQLAEAHMKEASKHITKVNALVKCEECKYAAIRAEQEGNMEQAKSHAEEAAKHEKDAHMLVDAETKKNAAMKAHAEGRPEESTKLMVAAKELESKALGTVASDVPGYAGGDYATY
jgi:hypothetical protein